MNQLPELLSQASGICGNDSRLAERLGVSRHTVCQWKIGAKPCPPEDQARLARIAGLDPLQALVFAHIERHAGTPKGAALADVFGEFLPQAIDMTTNKKAPELDASGQIWRKRKFSPRIKTTQTRLLPGFYLWAKCDNFTTNNKSNRTASSTATQLTSRFG